MCSGMAVSQKESKKYHDVDKGYSWIILVGW